MGMGNRYNHGKHFVVPTSVQSRHSSGYTNLIALTTPEVGTDLCFILTIAFLWFEPMTKDPLGENFDWVLKIMVGIVVISFFGVVIKLSTSGEADWGSSFLGLFPTFPF